MVTAATSRNSIPTKLFKQDSVSCLSVCNVNALLLCPTQFRRGRSVCHVSVSTAVSGTSSSNTAMRKRQTCCRRNSQSVHLGMLMVIRHRSKASNPRSLLAVTAR